MPELFIIAGCNGAGKTTAAYNLLPDVFNTTEFINADEIARGLTPQNVEASAFAAARIMLNRINMLIESKKNFAFETTLSGSNYLKVIEKAKANDFHVTLFFVYLENVSLALDRVAVRVLKGGHNIPSVVVKRRYFKGIINLPKYLQVVNSWYLLNNSAEEFEKIAEEDKGIKNVFNFDLYNTLIK